MRILFAGVFALSLAAAPLALAGPVTGAAKGAVIGHLAGHHAKAGAVIGAVKGAHDSKKRKAAKK